MIDNQALSTISNSIQALSQYASTLAEQYVIDSPVASLDDQNQAFVRIGRHKHSKTLLYCPKEGQEDLLVNAPIRAKVSFLGIFEAFFATYAEEGARFWADVDRAILKCDGCVSVAMEVVKEAAAKG